MIDGVGETVQKRALVYLRVSTPGQVEDGFSLASQQNLCRKHVESKGWTLVDVLTDGGVSGSTRNRDGLTAALQLAREGQIDILLSYDVDRFCRDPYEFMGIWRELRSYGILLAFVRSEYPQTAQGRFAMQIMALVAELETDQLRDRFERGKVEKAKSGKVVGGGRIAFGYRYAGGYLEFEPNEFSAVERIFRWYVSEGWSIRRIARTLSEEGVTTYSGREKWGKSSIARILSNETYAGTAYYNRLGRAAEYGPQNVLRPRDQWIGIPVPPIVDRATWEQAQERREHNRKFLRGQSRHEYLLSGFLVCDGCGFGYGGEFSKDRRWYRDGGRKHPTLVADVAEAAVWGAVRGFLLHPDSLFLGHRGTRQKALDDHERLQRQLDGIRKSMEKKGEKLERTVELYTDGDLTKEQYLAQRRKIETDLRQLENKAAKVESRKAAGPPSANQWRLIEQFTAAVSAGIDQLAFEEKRKVFDLLHLMGRVSHPKGNRPLVELEGAFPIYANDVVLQDGVLSTSSARYGPQRRPPPTPV